MIHLAATVLALLLAQDRTPDDVLQLKDQSILVGKIVRVDDKGITLELKTGGRIEKTFADLMPYSAYKIKLSQIDPASAAAHFALGEFCLAGGLYSVAQGEFDRAVELDAAFADRVAKRKAEARHEEARSRFEEAKKLVAERKYEEASKALLSLAERFGDTEYAAEARKEMTKVAEEIRKENEQRLRDLEAKQKAKEEQKVKKAEEGEKAVLAGAVEAVEEGRKAWGEGLEWEGKGNLSKGDKGFRAAEALLLTAKQRAAALFKSNDVAVLKQAKDVDKEADAWLVKTYYRLGRMWATEINYTESVSWLNKGLKIAPDDALLNEVLLELTKAQIRRRALGAKNPGE